MRILVIEDDYTFQVLIRGIIMTTLPALLDLVIVDKVSEAKEVLDESVTLVISDYDFDGGGFPALFPSISSLNLDYVVVSSSHRADVLQERFISKSSLVAGLKHKLKSLSA